MMRRTAISLLSIAALLSTVAGATWAVFSSSAKQADNTFATGTLEIRLNGKAVLPGFEFKNAAPDQCISGQFGVNNYGAPFFAGPSTLAAKEMVISAAKTAGDDDLFGALTVNIQANRGWPTWMDVFDGSLNSLTEKDLLTPRWSDLAAGNSEDVKYEVCLPKDAGNDLMGKSVTFDFVVDAYNPHR